MADHPLAPKVVLGIGAHPDDLDFGAAGSMAQFIRQGATGYYLILTDGCKGSPKLDAVPRELTRTRRQEQRNAGNVLGLADVFFLNYEDGALENTMALKKDIVRYIRQLKPDVVFAMDPSMLYSARRGFINHPDHRAGGQAALDAIYPLARDHLSFPDLLAAGYQPHNVTTVLLSNFDTATYAIDISDTLEQKLQALRAHASQIPDFAATSTFIRELAAKTGKTHGYRYAEAFVRLDVT